MGIRHGARRIRLPSHAPRELGPGKAGEQQLPSDGFIAHYLTGVLYPTDALDVVRALVALGVVASWIGFVTLRHRGSGRRAPV